MAGGIEQSGQALLTPKEVSREIKVPEATLTDWRYHGTGPVYVRVGRGIRYRRGAIDHWLDAHTVHTVAG